MEHGKVGEIYHLSTNQGIAVKDVVRISCEMMNVPFQEATRAVAERLGQDAAYAINSNKGRKEFNWRPLISMQEGFAQTIDWIERN